MEKKSESSELAFEILNGTMFSSFWVKKWQFILKKDQLDISLHKYAKMNYVRLIIILHFCFRFWLKIAEKVTPEPLTIASLH